MNFTILYTTCKNIDESRSLSKKLLKNKLAACVNTFEGGRSFYTWKESICEESEVYLFIKTVPENFENIEKLFEQEHSYETPCLIELNVGKVNEKYSNWLVNSFT